MSRWVFWIVVLAVVVRVMVGLLHPYWFPDSSDYDTLARGMLAGHGYDVGGKVASRMPGYPIFLAGIYAQTGGATWVVLVVQAVMGGVVVWLTYLIGRRVTEWVGIVAAVLVAVDPLSVAFGAAVLSEIPFTLALMVGVWICVCRLGPGETRKRWGWWAALGVVWAVAVYFRAEALWCVVPMGIVAGVGCGGRLARRLGGLLLAVVVMFLLLAPWQVRNYLIFGNGYFRMTTLEGISLYEAVYPLADGGPRQDFIEATGAMRELGEAARNDAWERRGWAYVEHDPGRIAGLAVRKVGRMWSPVFNAEGYRGGWMQVGMAAWYVPLFLLAALGVVTPGIGRVRWVLVVVAVYFTGVHALFLGSVRYRVPLEPIICIFAAVEAVRLVGSMRKGKRGSEMAV